MSDALADRVNAWVRIALTKAVVAPIAETDLHGARVPGIRRCHGSAYTESDALGALEFQLHQYGQLRLANGEALPTWASDVPEAHPDLVGLVRVTRLRKMLLAYAAEWGAPRENLPKGTLNAFCHDLGKLVQRHAMGMGNPQR
ncbi:MAG: hypothetical protein U0984_07570 [Prosthecobacter sp.]|nr:hypothetical protein [Prosthecobacter sp.]